MKERDLLVGLLVAGVATWLVLPAFGHGIYAVNGFDTPLLVTCGKEPPHRVAPGEVVRVFAPPILGVSAGVTTCRATLADGVVVDEAPVPYAPAQTSVFNARGAAPVYRRSVVYVRSGEASGPEPVVLAGHTVWMERVDYPFTEPPDTLSLRDSDSPTTRTALAIAPAGWRASVVYADPDRVMPIAQAVLEVEQGDEARAALVSLATRTLGPRVATKLSERLRLRTYDAARVRTMFAALPEDLTLRAELARALPTAEAEAVLREALVTQPDHVEAREALADLLTSTGRPAEALDLYETLPAGRDNLGPEALASVGRVEEAIAGIADDRPESARILRARLQAMITPPGGEEAPRSLGEARQLLYSRRGGDLEWFVGSLSEPERVAMAREWWATHDPARAWRRFEGVRAEELAEVPLATRLLLGLEFWRAGDEIGGRVLLESLSIPGWDDWEVLLDPSAPIPPLFLHTSGSTRGVIHLVRSRVLASEGNTEAADTALDAMHAAEEVRGVAHLAAREWPRL